VWALIAFSCFLAAGASASAAVCILAYAGWGHSHPELQAPFALAAALAVLLLLPAWISLILLFRRTAIQIGSRRLGGELATYLLASLIALFPVPALLAASLINVRDNVKSPEVAFFALSWVGLLILIVLMVWLLTIMERLRCRLAGAGRDHWADAPGSPS
jgi:hypothetical protein